MKKSSSRGESEAMSGPASVGRREFLTGSLALGVLASCSSSSLWSGAFSRPQIPYGVQTGDPTAGGMMVWSRADRAAKMSVEWATNDAFRGAVRVDGPMATAETDYTARVELKDLPAGERIFYRVTFEAQEAKHARSEPCVGSFRAAPKERQDVLLAWSGDTAGQGYGIDVSRGGMKTFGAIADNNPDLFLHAGDRIYADEPLPDHIRLADGTIWKNIVTRAKSKVAETLEEYRGAHAYNFLDEHVRRLHAHVPTITTWDDHEVHNNWYPGQIIDDARYQEKRISVLAARAKQAAMEYSPMRGESFHRTIGFGPLVEVFVLDGRSYRGRQRDNDGSLSMFGQKQVRWFCEALERSRAVWKIVVCGTPMGMVIPSGMGIEDGIGNGSGAPSGREKEIATILEFIKARKIQNVVWVTAEVHYASAFHYHPSRARGVDFLPFWQFTAGPLHAGTFGPDEVDETFGPEVRYRSVAPGALEYQPPVAATQSFGLLRVDGKTAGLRVSLHDGSGRQMWAVELEAEGIRAR